MTRIDRQLTVHSVSIIDDVSLSTCVRNSTTFLIVFFFFFLQFVKLTESTSELELNSSYQKYTHH